MEGAGLGGKAPPSLKFSSLDIEILSRFTKEKINNNKINETITTGRSVVSRRHCWLSRRKSTRGLHVCGETHTLRGRSPVCCCYCCYDVRAQPSPVTPPLHWSHWRRRRRISPVVAAARPASTSYDPRTDGRTVTVGVLIARATVSSAVTVGQLRRAHNKKNKIQTDRFQFDNIALSHSVDTGGGFYPRNNVQTIFATIVPSTHLRPRTIQLVFDSYKLQRI